ncbi:MAG: DnaJ domain-containing protein [Dehalococcoidia bacterium]|nr:DnaJ domain-containing protein [Dehalococcoidia bacterium]
MTENSDKRHYETLQVTSQAEPEVVAAAYRALAKKYHPDRSSVPDAMNRMARLNVAYQVIRSRIGTANGDAAGDSPTDNLEAFAPEIIDPNGSLEEITDIISHKLAVARERVIAEVQSQGLPRDITMALVTKALKDSIGIQHSPQKSKIDTSSTPLDVNGSYDSAMRIVSSKASRAREELADQLVKEGLQRHVATELLDNAFEALRHSGKERRADAARLSPERVDLSASLEKGTILVIKKLTAARNLVIQELTSDGMPQKTAEQLVNTSVQQMTRTYKGN